MSDLLSYLYTVLTRIWDFLTYPFELLSHAVTYVNNAWDFAVSIVAYFPAWLTGSILLVFALGVVLFVLRR